VNAFRSAKDPADLEYRLQRLHLRRRRALIHQVVNAALWGAGLLLMGAFALALALGYVSK
jgi:hypothetical protein